MSSGSNRAKPLCRWVRHFPSFQFLAICVFSIHLFVCVQCGLPLVLIIPVYSIVLDKLHNLTRPLPFDYPLRGNRPVEVSITSLLTIMLVLKREASSMKQQVDLLKHFLRSRAHGFWESERQ